MYCALRTHLLDHNSPTSDELLHSLLTPLGFFSHPSAPKNTREPDLLGKMVEYMRFLHVTMRNTQADPRWCAKLEMSNVNGISQLTAQVFALKKELNTPSGGSHAQTPTVARAHTRTPTVAPAPTPARQRRDASLSTASSYTQCRRSLSYLPMGPLGNARPLESQDGFARKWTTSGAAIASLGWSYPRRRWCCPWTQ